MTRSLIGLVLLVVFVGAAHTDGYGDFNSGVAAANRDEHDQAIKSLSAALTDADLPEHLRATALLARGQEHFEKQEFDLAAVDFAAAAKLKPDWPDPFLLQCAVLASQKLFSQAIEKCTSAIQLQPQNWRLRTARISLYAATKNYDSILSEYASIIAARPQSINLLLDRSHVYQVTGDFDKAIADAELAAQRNEHATAPNWTLERIYFAKGDFEKSLGSADILEAQLPHDATVLLAEGQNYWALGRYEDSFRALTKSLNVFKHQAYSFLWLSIVAAELHRTVPDEIPRGFSDANLSVWPGDLVKLYLGTTTPDAVISLKGQDADTGEGMQCTVGFFVGAWYNIKGDTANAKQLLQSASSSCDANFATRRMALVALSRIP